jgi:ribonuclease Z
VLHRCILSAQPALPTASNIGEPFGCTISGFVIIAAEFNGAGFDRICEFRAREAFRRHDLPEVQQSPGLLLDEDEFRIDGAMLDHGIPCLAFALTEKLRVNVWREGLRQLELPVGPRLREAKRAVRQGAPADRQISIPDDLSMPLGVLRQGALRTARGQKIAYIVDIAYHQGNVEKAIALARDADRYSSRRRSSRWTSISQRGAVI